MYSKINPLLLRNEHRIGNFHHKRYNLLLFPMQQMFREFKSSTVPSNVCLQSLLMNCVAMLFYYDVNLQLVLTYLR